MDFDKLVAILVLLGAIVFCICIGYIRYTDNAAKVKQLEIITQLFEKGKLSQEAFLLKMEQLK